MAGLYPLIKGPHYATELEITINHIAQNDQVFFMTCNGQLKRCITNPLGIKNRCEKCIARREYDLMSTGISHLIKRITPQENSKLNLNIPDFSSINQLKTFNIDNIDIGMGVASSLISDIRDPSPDMKQYRERIINNINISYQHKLAFEMLLEQVQPDIFYLFNGRYSFVRPLLRMAQQKKILTYVHESGSLFNSYSLFKNTYPHDLAAGKERIDKKWEAEQDLSRKQSLAIQWFNNRRKGIYTNRRESFTRLQVIGKLPNMNDDKINIGIFNSSEDEFEAIEGWENPIYKNQIDALQTLVQDTRWNSNIHFFLRVHPNLKNKNNSQTKYIEQLSSDRITVIAAEASISTYDLIDACDAIITYGSTVGIESSFFGTPSILLGRSQYEDMGVCIRPKSHDELVDIINNKRYLTVDLDQVRTNAFKYAYYFATEGIPFRHFTQTNLWEFERNKTTCYQRFCWRLLSALKGRCLRK